MVNRMVLSGVISKTPVRDISPNGIPHCQFYLEHRSEQTEMGLKRRVQCFLPVVIAGHNELGNSLRKGSRVRISGFVNMRYHQNKMNQLILHAVHVEFLGE